MTNHLKIRFYLPSDRETVEEWHIAHSSVPTPESILPKFGIVVDAESGPMCAMWLYMDNSCPVCFPEHAISRPGLSVKESKEAFICAMNFFRICAKEMGFQFMILNTLPGIARIMKGQGFIVAGKRQKITMIGTTERRDCHGS
jgi:hypothetical protein